MRRLLDGLYAISGGLAGIFMIGVLVAILMSIGTRQLGYYIGGLDAYAGYSMAAAGFLALGHTFKSGEHIRVTLVLGLLPQKGRIRLDIFALLIACVLAANLAWYSSNLVHDSFLFHDISTSDDATPLWIPQIGMAVGTFIFLIAIIDETVRRLRGHPESTLSEEMRYE